MAPSRGLPHLRQIVRLPVEARSSTALARRGLSSFSEKLANPAHKVQSYISHSRDPYLNLSIEDHILRTSPPDSTVLFLYTNRPCVVIGRNQNPWCEVNLGILNPAAERASRACKDTEPPGIGDVALVRRRSGGGTVFHDQGNVNWSITCPREDFTRDKHAEMVVRALRQLGVDRARVNERHDIVLDQGAERRPADPRDTHRTAYTVDEGRQPKPLKVSGSAYKITRRRALHHATTLLASPNLHIIPQYLHSPGKPFIEAKGVESVSSPVGNIGLDNDIFQRHLQDEFAAMYGGGKQVVVETVGDGHLDIPEIKKGYNELKTKDWIMSQTPQFTLRIDPSNDAHKPNQTHIEMTVRHGIIESLDIVRSGNSGLLEKLRPQLVGRKLQDIENWHQFLTDNVSDNVPEMSNVAKVLDEFLPIPETP